MGNHLLVFSLRVWGSGRRCMGFVEDVAEPVAAFFAVLWDFAVSEVLGGCVPDMGYLEVVEA